MSNKYRDFDAFMAENQDEPISFTMYGEEHHLPASLPASVVLKIVRMQKDLGPDKEVDNVALFETAQDLLGAELLEDLCKKGMSTKVMSELITWAMEQYNPAPGDENPGNSPSKAPVKKR